MSQKTSIQSEISGYISNLFRTHFGKGPSAVYVTLERSYITIHFRGFLAAMEKNLVNQNEMTRVLVTRNMIVRDLEPEIARKIEELTGYEVKEFYTDWDFEKETGLMIGIMEEELHSAQLDRSSAVDESAVREYINRTSEKLQKVPELTSIYWLNERTILIRRLGILLEIEKELIKNGFIDELKVTKRELERRAFQEAHPEKVLMGSVEEMFLYWNFNKDLSYAVFRLKPETR